MVETSYICQQLSCYVFTRESIATLISYILSFVQLTEEEVLVLPVVGHLPPSLLPPLHRNHISKKKHIGYCDVGVFQILQWCGDGSDKRQERIRDTLNYQ